MTQKLIDISNYIVKKYKVENSPIRFQKLLFFAYWENLKAIKTNQNFINGFDNVEFEAWMLGPVQFDIWKLYKSYFFENGKLSIIGEELKVEEKKLLDKFLKSFKNLSISELIDKSRKNIGWVNARKRLGVFYKKVEPCHEKLKNKEILLGN